MTLIVTDVTSEYGRRRELEEALARERAERDQIVERGRQTAASHAQLLEANAELTTANAELRSANEELLVANEEVQAATEEVETLNEELQATNEELETLNEELQATVEELNTTNDDLQARNLEALATTDTSTPAARVILAAARRILEDRQPVAVIGQSAEADLQNPAFQALFDGTTIAAADGTPVDDANHPVARARRGEAFEAEFLIRRGRRAAGRFEVRSTPIAGSSGVADGRRGPRDRVADRWRPWSRRSSPSGATPSACSVSCPSSTRIMRRWLVRSPSSVRSTASSRRRAPSRERASERAGPPWPGRGRSSRRRAVRSSRPQPDGAALARATTPSGAT
ncbi:MAG TPA: hypothetical protein VFJ71_12315 [Candidatus Limnocylindrales bacterium]|nr:hypothetical protein [Candidatus Limnocylindrales bacterium]